MTKNFLISWAVVFVVWMVGSFVVHGVLLNELYATLPNLYRSETDTQALSYLVLIAHLIMAGSFVWIYQRGAEDKPWLAQGLRFGLAVALLAAVPTYIMYYVVQPMPLNLAVQQAIGDGLLLLILGMVAAFLHRRATQLV